MELSPTDSRLKSIGNIDLFKTDEKYNVSLPDILRTRQQPLLVLIDRESNLLCASVPPVGIGSVQPEESICAQRLIDDALVEVQSKFTERRTPAASVVHQLTINKPGERCTPVRAYLKSIRAKLDAKTRPAIVSIVHGCKRRA